MRFVFQLLQWFETFAEHTNLVFKSPDGSDKAYMQLDLLAIAKAKVHLTWLKQELHCFRHYFHGRRHYRYLCLHPMLEVGKRGVFDSIFSHRVYRYIRTGNLHYNFQYIPKVIKYKEREMTPTEFRSLFRPGLRVSGLFILFI
jgi:hypothetical protein